MYYCRIVDLVIQAHMALNEVDDAIDSFKKAKELEPNDG